MPRGKRNSLQLREIIARLYLWNALTPLEIFAFLYRSNRRLCSFEYLTKLCGLLRNPIFRASYLIGSRKTPGRPLSQSYFNRLLIRQSVFSNKTRHVKCTEIIVFIRRNIRRKILVLCSLLSAFETNWALFCTSQGMDLQSWRWSYDGPNRDNYKSCIHSLLHWWRKSGFDKRSLEWILRY